MLIALNVSVAYDGAGSSTVENLSISGGMWSTTSR